MISAATKISKPQGGGESGILENRRVVVMAGGTGGHVFPALAVAEELRRRGVQIDWLGTRNGIEAELVPANLFPLHCIEVKGVRGKSVGARLLAPFQVVRAVFQALKILRRLAPHAVIGLGGYASGPGGLAAKLLAIPLVIHEQNAVAGTTNRILSRFASRVLQAFPGAFAGAEVTGNPVRREIAELAPPSQRGVGQHRPVRLLILGGSLGASAINQLVPAALARLNQGRGFEVRHQCGRKHEQTTQEAYTQAGVAASVEPFIADMAAAYTWADFVICRAGALTVSELAAAGVGALLIPFPAAIDDHQTKNGDWLAKGGAALLAQQRELSADKLAAMLKEIEDNPKTMITMAENARRLASTDAARRVANVCVEVMK